jgi:hypothetical protein
VTVKELKEILANRPDDSTAVAEFFCVTTARYGRFEITGVQTDVDKTRDLNETVMTGLMKLVRL